MDMLCSRTPQGVRGLKFTALLDKEGMDAESHPARGAWIEIEKRLDSVLKVSVAPRKGCVD